MNVCMQMCLHNELYANVMRLSLQIVYDCQLMYSQWTDVCMEVVGFFLFFF